LDCGEQYARRRRDSTVEAQLSDRDIMGESFSVCCPDRCQQTERNRQIVMRAFLGQVGRRQVHRDPFGREREADRGERRSDPLTAFGYRLVGKADDDERRQARRELDLDLDGASFQAEVGNGGDGRGHQARPSQLTTLFRLPPSSAARG